MNRVMNWVFILAFPAFVLWCAITAPESAWHKEHAQRIAACDAAGGTMIPKTNLCLAHEAIIEYKGEEK